MGEPWSAWFEQVGFPRYPCFFPLLVTFHFTAGEMRLVLEVALTTCCSLAVLRLLGLERRLHSLEHSLPLEDLGLVPSIPMVAHNNP